jgi:hypothetical protein
MFDRLTTASVITELQSFMAQGRRKKVYDGKKMRWME